MVNPQLAKGIGVVDGDIRNHQISDQQLREHIGADVALLDKLAGGAARKL